MSNRNYRPIESIRLEAELSLADFLFDQEIISESAYAIEYMGTKTFDLMESASRSNSPGYYYGKGKDAIYYVDFRNIWNNVKDYPSTEDVYRVFHPSVQNVEANTATTWSSRVLNKFLGGNKGDPGVPEARTELVAKTTRERTDLEKKIRAGEAEELADDFGEYSIDGGYQRKSSRSGNIERASTLFPGELYSDQSRIPKRRWGSWWKRFLRARTSVADPESGLLAMRKWSKHFIMGYQITPNLLFEIWYNNMDSTFSVHDKYGNVVQRGDSIPLIRDALNVLFHNVADASPKDAEILNMRTPSLRRVNQDIEAALSGSVDSARSYAERVRDRKEKTIQQQEAERKRRQEKEERGIELGADIRGEETRKSEEETVQSFRDRVKNAVKDKAKEAAKQAADNYKQSTQSGVASPSYAKNTKQTDDVSDEAARRREARQAEAMRREETRDAERKRKMETEKLKAQSELAAKIDDLSQELEDMRSDPAYFDDEATRQEEIRKAEQELADVQKAVAEYEDDDFDSRLKAEFEKLNKKIEASNKRREKKKSDDSPSLDDYVNSGKNKKKKSVNESAIDDLLGGQADNDAEFDLQDYDMNPLYRPEVNREVEQTRQKAENSPFTKQLINSMFLEGFVQVYDQTRVKDNRTFIRRIFDRLKIFRGRVEPIALPSRIVSSYMKVKGFFAGAQARADFIIGYTINDVANFEIWYVQEISADGTQQYASFYLYDVTAMKIIQKNIPHYRNAVQLLILKIGSEDTKGA